MFNNITSEDTVKALNIHGVENPSPALSLTLSVGNDKEGWPDYRMFNVQGRYFAIDGNPYKIVGFTKDNLICVIPCFDTHFVSSVVFPAFFNTDIV